MKYYLVPLKFLTPVHFGDAANGGGLEKSSFACAADTFFSALCNEAAAQSRAAVEELIDGFNSGRLQISSLLPYYKTQDEDMYFYLPKPLLPLERNIAEAKSFAEMKQAATKLKKAKKSSYVRASQIKKFLAPEPFLENTQEFAVPVLSAKVNTRNAEPLPYYVASYRFVDNAGLYLICGTESDADYEKLKALIASLGLSGIGGKRSGGYGKFVIRDDEDDIELAPGFGCYEDDAALAEMLFAEKSRWQMCIAPVFPKQEQIADIKAGAYKLIKKSGFVYSLAVTNGVKRTSAYMLAEGSCFQSRLRGSLLRQAVPGLEHAVYRNGLGMFVGLKND
ncbi:MAG: type III-A CRISPR-associated RAMP protein Csm4 [Phascolarctobacterium sp.]|uniref:type III-A CRISPR-associated RAMP protein Csm4 n=1 Tax=Phascolarctobacterium sp. TaxID=2049039 RepID=UPI0026DD6789|nr:type III-A CRISPR-associated RAMP protein Csm4 [Phascolarctobacterium sp.]MDO4921635.1 type III-A CRISPR-associated RAMP protein Csm4 [Phascolarctobacterium sp.]